MKEINDNICEECEKEDESVRSNLILIGYKVCDSCKLSKIIFPVYFETLIQELFYNQLALLL